MPWATESSERTFHVLTHHEGASTLDEGVPAQSLDHLDWYQLCSLIADECRLEESTAVASHLPLLREREAIVHRLGELQELLALRSDGERPPQVRLESIRTGLQRAIRGAMLEARELMQIAQVAEAFSAVRSFYQAYRERAPRLWGVAGEIASGKMSELRRAIQQSFTPAGTIADGASPDLKRLRRRVSKLHEQMRNEIERKVKVSQLEGTLQDDYFTIRKGRYVLPVKVEHRSRFDGIVHDHSASGQTVFVEPAEMIELNNHLHMAAFEVQAEERRILERFSRLVESHHDALEDGYRRLVYLDLSAAAATFSDAIRATIPRISEDGSLHLEHARHPVLELRLRAEGRELVSNTIALDPSHAVLVISGSNAGGKTVTLKTLGIFSLMLRAGLPLPVEPGSKLPIFWKIFTDVGDQQSIQYDTSTFSGHVQNLKSFIDKIDDRSLVLLDEPFAGTDPPHAAALGTALLEHLRDAGARGVITTHLDRLKAFAMEQDWLRNASVGFNLVKLHPTYELELDFPGSSCALEIASRLGLPRPLLERATALRDEDPTMGVEKLLRDVNDEREMLRRARQQAEEEVEKVAAERRQLRKAIREARERDRHTIDKASRRFINEANRLRNQLARQVKRLQQGEPLDHAEIEALRQEMEKAEAAVDSSRQRVEEKLPEPEPERDPVPESALSPGEAVFSQSYQKPATVVDVDEDRGQVTIQIGVFKVDVPFSDLLEGEREKPATPRTRRAQGGAPQSHAPAASGDEAVMVRSSDNTCDLRGCRVDEGLERLDLFIDSAMRRELDAIFIIHGHGTGAMRKGVRQYLSRTQWISAFRAGDRHEGGNGVTIAKLSS